MSTKSIAPKRPSVKAMPAGTPDLSIALCKARAASILLRADDDYLQMPFPLKAGEEEDVREWIKIFAFDALGAALEEAEDAEAAGQEGHGAPKRAPKRKAVA